MTNRFVVIFISFIAISFILSPLARPSKAVEKQAINSVQSQYIPKIESSDTDVEHWLTFVSILTTLFAIFFVYTGFKIDSTKEKVDEAEKRVLNLEKNIQDEIYEYARQLEYCMSYIIQRQFDKAIDALTILRNEHFVLKDDRKINTCCFFLAHCYYERGLQESDQQKQQEDLAYAVAYIDQAIDDSMHPLKQEIINAFNNAPGT